MSEHKLPVRYSLPWLIQKGHLLREAQLLACAGWDDEVLRTALGNGGIFFLEHQGDRYYPGFYADAGYERAQLETIAKLLEDLRSGAKLLFFITPKGSLDGATPLEALALGRFRQVCVAAAGCVSS